MKRRVIRSMFIGLIAYWRWYRMGAPVAGAAGVGFDWDPPHARLGAPGSAWIEHVTGLDQYNTKSLLYLMLGGKRFPLTFALVTASEFFGRVSGMGFCCRGFEGSQFPVAFVVILTVMGTFLGNAPILLSLKSVKILNFTIS